MILMQGNSIVVTKDLDPSKIENGFTEVAEVTERKSEVVIKTMVIRVMTAVRVRLTVQSQVPFTCKRKLLLSQFGKRKFNLSLQDKL